MKLHSITCYPETELINFRDMLIEHDLAEKGSLYLHHKYGENKCRDKIVDFFKPPPS